jgi:trehalose 6-phosphate phosphatase
LKKIPDKPEVINAPDFWSRLRNSKKPFLGLDYDGTLAPFRVNRTEAYPLPGVVGLLKDIDRTTKTFVAIVSGRPISELMSLVGEHSVTFVGSHGFEFKYPGSEICTVSLSARQEKGLEIARQILKKLDLVPLMETKAGSVALHTRALQLNQAELVAGQVFSLWTDLASSNDLDCNRFNGGIEILAAGWNKGRAVLKLLAGSEVDLPVYIGDDTTDEDVFKVLKGRGIGIRVGPPQTPTAADGFLPNCEAVRELLKTWLSLE